MKPSILFSVVLFLALFNAFARATDTPVFLAEIKQIVQAESESYEQLLARIWPIADKAFHDRKWEDVERELRAVGIEPVEERFFGSFYRCVVQPGAFTMPGGFKLDLYLTFQVSQGRSQPTNTVPPNNTVWKVRAGLSATIVTPVDQVRSQQTFGEITLIQDALADWAVTDTQSKFPLLETVDLVCYGWNDRGKQDFSRYELELSFVKDKDNRQARRRLKCIALDEDGKGRGPLRDWTFLDFHPPGAASSLAHDLKKLVEEGDPSYQVLLSKATRLVRDAVQGREWPDVSKELEGQGLELIKDSDVQYGRWITYRVAKDSFVTPAGQKMDLFIKFDVGRRTWKSRPTQHIVSAYAGLTAQVDMPYKDVLTKEMFGKDTAIHKALLVEESHKATERCPVLNSVEVQYRGIGDRWSEWNGCGFYVQPHFTTAIGDESKYISVSVMVPSRLDPVSNHNGIAFVKDFVPTDTLGEPRVGGSGSKGFSDYEQEVSAFLTRKGESPYRRNYDDLPKPVIAYSIGDIKSLPANITHLRVESSELYDNDLASFARFASLKSLYLGESEGITDTGLVHLAGLKNLESLTICGELLTGDGFQHLPGLVELTVYRSESLTDEGISRIAQMKDLKHLHLSSARNLTDEHVARLTKLSDLRVLRLWNVDNVSDEGLNHVATITKLEEFWLSGAKRVTPAGLARLGQLKDLKDIMLSYMPLGDDALEPLSRMDSLEYVWLNDLNITGKGIQVLAKLPRLKRVYIHGGDAITNKDVDDLKQKLPGEFIRED